MMTSVQNMLPRQRGLLDKGKVIQKLEVGDDPVVLQNTRRNSFGCSVGRNEVIGLSRVPGKL